jgi:hypothetical protein
MLSTLIEGNFGAQCKWQVGLLFINSIADHTIAYTGTDRKMITAANMLFDYQTIPMQGPTMNPTFQLFPPVLLHLPARANGLEESSLQFMQEARTYGFQRV